MEKNTIDEDKALHVESGESATEEAMGESRVPRINGIALVPQPSNDPNDPLVSNNRVPRLTPYSHSPE
jgi:hypothetical protein